jgi:RNA ligase (TIGR02306 family)
VSTLKAEVVPIELHEHPNADSLSIVKVKGWQVVVKTEDFEGVDIGGYIPIDSVLPQSEEWEFLKQYKYRVRSIKLRGQISQGLLIPARGRWKLGDDITEELKIQKYDPPVPVHLAGDMIKEIPGFQKYTNIENWKNYPHIFKEGENIIITEKIHGTNARYAILDDRYCVGTHRTCRNPEGKNIYSTIGRDYAIEDRLRSAFKEDCNVILYGEIYGKSIQDLRYGTQKPELAVFDILIDGEFMAFWEVKNACNHMGLSIVPVLYDGLFEKNVLDLAEGEAFDGGHMREGIVIQPQLPEWHPEIGRKILKRISDRYLLRKKGSEYH